MSYVVNIPSINLSGSFADDSTVACEQPILISGDGFYLYGRGNFNQGFTNFNESFDNTVWFRYDITPSVRLNAVDRVGDVALFAGNNGVVVRFDLYEQSSSISVLDPNINFYNVKYYSGSSAAVIIGESGSIYKTTNAGLTWQQLSTPVWLTASLRAITFSSGSVPNQWWICGDKGTIISSSNEGTTFYKYRDFLQYDSSGCPTLASNPPFINSNQFYTSSLSQSQYEEYDFYDILYTKYPGNLIQYDRIYVAGSSGSLFASAPVIPAGGTFTNASPVRANQFYDVSLAFMQLDYSHTSSIYKTIIYSNEYYYTGSTGNNHQFPTNIAVAGTNGKHLFIDFLEDPDYPWNPSTPIAESLKPIARSSWGGGSTTPYGTGNISFFDRKYVNFTEYYGAICGGNPGDYYTGVAYATYTTYSLSQLGDINKGGLFNLLRGSDDEIFADRYNYVLTETGLLVQMNYPSSGSSAATGLAGPGNALVQSADYGAEASESFNGALTDIHVGDFTNREDLFGRTYVRFSLDAPFPTDDYGNVLWYGQSQQYFPNQGMRIYRGFERENFVSVDRTFPNGKGFVIPQSYTPGLNYLEIAKKAGLLPNP